MKLSGPLPSNVKRIRKNGAVPEGFMRATEYAKRIDISKPRLSTVVYKEQKVSALKRGKETWINIAEADLVFKYMPARPATRVLSPVAARMKAKQGQKSETMATVLADPFAIPIDYIREPKATDDEFTLSQRLAFEKVRTAKRENDHADGLTVEKAPMVDLWYKISRNTRDSVEAVAPRVASKLVGKTAFEIEQILTAELKKALSTLIDEII
jgi:hypothetical protein